jgi:hypothetical protein
MAIITGTLGDDNNLLKDIIEFGSLSLDQPKLIQEDLYFGRNIAGGGEVSEAEFQAFIDAEITPQFPDGLTVYETNGQFLDSNGNFLKTPQRMNKVSISSLLHISNSFSKNLSWKWLMKKSTLALMNRQI